MSAAQSHQPLVTRLWPAWAAASKMLLPTALTSEPGRRY
jgi:hypothetical protein